MFGWVFWGRWQCSDFSSPTYFFAALLFSTIHRIPLTVCCLTIESPPRIKPVFAWACVNKLIPRMGVVCRHRKFWDYRVTITISGSSYCALTSTQKSVVQFPEITERLFVTSEKVNSVKLSATQKLAITSASHHTISCINAVSSKTNHKQAINTVLIDVTSWKFLIPSRA